MAIIQFFKIIGFMVLTCMVFCGTNSIKDYNEKNMTEKNSLGEIKLKAEGKIDDNKLVVEYSFINNSNGVVYVFDEMIRYEKYEPKIDKDTAYCFYEEPNTLRLVRAVLKEPKGMRVYSLEIPYAREVKEQSTITGKIILDIPVKEKSPFYAPPKEENSKEFEVKEIRLMIGWTEFREGTKITETDIAGEKVLRIRGNWKPNLVEDSFSLKTNVVTYTDNFDRQMPQQFKEN
jgi:hypothetical protein